MYEPGIAPDGTSPRPYVAAGGGWMAGRRSWTARATVQHRPQLRPVLSSVVGTLVRHGLAEQTDRTPEAMQQLVTDLGMQVTPGAAGSSADGRPRSWVSVCSGTTWRPAPTPQPRMSREHCPHDPFGNRSPRCLGLAATMSHRDVAAARYSQLSASPGGYPPRAGLGTHVRAAQDLRAERACPPSRDMRSITHRAHPDGTR